MNKITPFVIQKIEEKLTYRISDKGACAELRRSLHNSESENGLFSLNTIKRWFGLIEKQVEPQQNGLEAIAEYLGYPSWAALTQEIDYNQQKEKTEEDYISDIFFDYKSLVQSINDYQFKKDVTKDQSEIVQCENKLKELKHRQQIIKDAIVKLSDLLTDPTPYQSDVENIESLFKGKHYEEANKLLNLDKLKEEQAILFRALKKKLSDKTKIEMQLKKNAYCFYIKAEICNAWNNWAEAEEYYLLSLQSQRIFDTMFALGLLYAIQKQDNTSAIKMFEEIIQHAKEIISLKSFNFFCEPRFQVSMLISSIFNAGKINFTQNRFEEGFRRMDLVIELYQTIQNCDSRKDIQLEVGNVYNEQGNVFITQNDFDKAEMFYKKALEIYKHFSEFDYLETLINLAYVYADKGIVELAENTLNQSLEYFNSLYKKDDSIENQQMLLLRIAKCFSALGYLQYKNKDLEKSILSYKRAGLTYSNMFDIAPSSISTLGMVDTDIMLSRLHDDSGKHKEAASYRYTIFFSMQTNDTVFDHIHKQHPDFFQWLGKILDDK